MKRLIIDPGHGGHDSGAVSPSGLKESDVVLDVSKRLKEYLGNRVDVILSRDDDSFLTLQERADFATGRGADFFLSIHCNSAKNKSAHGFEVFTSPGDTHADPFATDLFSEYSKEFPNLAARKNLDDGDPDKEARFTVLTRSICPAALFELEFIHSDKGDRLLKDSVILERMAAALGRGVLNHFGIDHPASEAVEVEDQEEDKTSDAIEHLKQAIKLLSPPS